MSRARGGLRIGPNLTLPIDLAVEATAVVGKRGRGKTYTSKRIVEETLRAGVTCLVIDPTDVWWGLRSDADGGDGGLDVVVIGGKHGDVPVREGTGKLLARLVLDGTSIVLVVKGLPKASRRRLVGELLTELYDQADGTPVLVVVDEADEYAPEGARAIGNRRDDPLMLSLGAVEDIVRRGRAGGLGSLLITQRVAALSKNVLEQSDTLIALGVTGANDIDAVQRWIGKHAASADAGRELIASLPGLPKGTAWVWSPEYGVLSRVEVLPIRTFDSSRSPKVGEVAVEPKARKAIDLDALGAEMAHFAEQVKADDPKALRARIADLERQLAERPDVEPERVEVRVLNQDDTELADRIIAAMRDTAGRLEQTGKEWFDAAQQIASRLALATPPTPVIPVKPYADAIKVAKPGVRVVEDNGPQPAPPRPAPQPIEGSGSSLSKAEDALLCALVARHPIPMTLRELGVAARRSHTSSTTQTAVSHLRSLGLASGSNRQLVATEAGVALVGPVEPMPNDRSVIEWWCSRLTTAEAALLRTIVRVYPETMTPEDIAVAAGYSPTSSTFQTALSRLRSLGLVDRVGRENRATAEVGEAWLRG